MHGPVTTNPFIIMLINMVIVFAVLFGLSLVIRLIHVVDPTRKREKKIPEPVTAEVAAPVKTGEPEMRESGVNANIVAAITAAIAMIDKGNYRVKAIRPVSRDGWKMAARADAQEKL